MKIDKNRLTVMDWFAAHPIEGLVSYTASWGETLEEVIPLPKSWWPFAPKTKLLEVVHYGNGWPGNIICLVPSWHDEVVKSVAAYEKATAV